MRMLASIVLFAASASSAYAQELVPWPHRDGASAMELRSHATEIRVRDLVAEVTVNATFHNPNDQEIEGMYFMSLPPDAQVNRFVMTVNGKEQAAELLDAKRAREIYDRIVNARRDPALLELTGHQMLKASVYPIAPKGDVKIQVGYVQALAAESGLVGITVPLARALTNPRPIEQVTLTASIESRTAIKTVYSPTHPVDVIRKDDHTVKTSFEAKGYASRQDLTLYYALSDADVGVNLLTFREAGEDGFFVLMVSPRVDVAREKVLPKDVIFVMDRSGSMSGEKMRQAREALAQCVNALSPGDRFNIVDFSTEASAFQSGLVDAQEFRGQALRYAEALKARGSTNIDGALTTALKMLQPDRKRMSIVLFMTDGLPTVGEQNPDAILKNAKASIPAGIEPRIFVFGVGNDVNTQFLDRLAEEGRGARDYVAPEEKIEAKASALFEKIASPVLAGLSVEYGGIQTSDVYPKQLPDLFKGQQLTVLGRYRTNGAAAITLKGVAAGEERTFRYDVRFPDKDVKCDFLPRLWAGRKIAFLVDAVRLGGAASQEVIDEIVSLGRKYGIVTQYTSFLITEDDAHAFKGRAEERLRELQDDARRSGASDAPRPAAAVQGASRDLEAKKKGDLSLDKFEKEAEELAKNCEKAGGRIVRMKTVGARTFYLHDGVWVDGRYDDKDKGNIVKVKFLGDDYKKLIDENPELAKYFAVGDSVIVCLGGRIYQVEK